MRNTFVASLLAAVVVVATMGQSLADPIRPTRETMLRRCEQKALACEKVCDNKQMAGKLTDKQYKSCNNTCEDKVRKCRRMVDEVRPERKNTGGGPAGKGGPVLSPK
ncbi:MAG: hypothetical protein ABI399_08930 [Bauldia sp.]